MKSLRIVIMIDIISKKVFRSLRFTYASHVFKAVYMIAVVEYVVRVATSYAGVMILKKYRLAV